MQSYHEAWVEVKRLVECFTGNLDAYKRAEAAQTGHLARFIIFGSSVTAKSDPGDVDIFLLRERQRDRTGLVPRTVGKRPSHCGSARRTAM
jgi:hypothetical protein